jgi:hypothetical protein
VGQKGEMGRRSVPFYGGSAARAERKGAGGSGVQRHVEGKIGNREGSPSMMGTAQVASIGPWPAGVGGAIAARQARAADRLDRATSGPVGSGWVREGVGQRSTGR